jgi:hypothetical protein
MKITVAEDYRDLKKMQSFNILKWHGLTLLKETVEPFFNCNIEFCFKPIEQAKALFNIDLLENPGRGCYPIDDDTFFLYARVLRKNELISGIGLLLKGKYINFHKHILNDFEGALTRTFSSLFTQWFRESTLVLGDALLTHTICNYCIRARIDYRNFEHLITYFHKLSGTTFEGNSFSTGLIVTKSALSFQRRGDEVRHGQVFALNSPFVIKNSLKIDRRMWYLVDGKNTFYVANKALNVQNIFIVDEKYAELGYIDNNSLSLTLKSGDTLFRIENEKQFSIINSDGIEFTYLENNWKIRNYNLVKTILRQYIEKENVINDLLFFILYCSKNSISSVVWIPSDLGTVSSFVRENTLNKLINEDISICDKKFSNQIIRYLSSDGATIIDTDGNVRNFGCIVDLTKLNIKGIKGTGESAAQALSTNGVSFKVSQDGMIKMFISDLESPILI